MKHSITRVTALLLVTLLTLGGMTACGKKPAETQTDATPTDTPIVSTVESVVSSAPESSAAESSTAPSKPAVSKPQSTTVQGNPVGDLGYNTNLNIEDNVFMDALIYTGYNMEKHRADGNMWVYILSERKRGLGYLSNITYGGGSSGLETTPDGKPDIKAFERGGLVCASFATYVYFNYLPNVAGIDTSMLTKPDRTYNAHSFYTAAKDWVAKGYARTIGFTASRTGYNYINFKENEDIPIGSIIVFEDDRKHDGRGSHITVYGGYKNGHHWVYQVGTSNGPEMCAIERMLFGPDPQWPLAVIVPTVLRMSATAQISVTDEAGAPVAGTIITLTNQNGKQGATLTTDANGKAAKDGLSYGNYQITVTPPDGYTVAEIAPVWELTPKNNSVNELTVKVKKS